jgi:hypothetical protein
MAGRKSIFTPEMQELILNNFRHTGNLKNSAIRAGMSERSFYRWKDLCEKAKSGTLYRFWQEVTRAKANRLAMLASRHYLRSLGGVFRMPVYDSSFNLVCDQSGKPVTIAKVLPPDASAMWREMTLLDPETYDLQKKRNAPIPQPLDEPEHMQPSEMEDMFIAVARRMQAHALGVSYEPEKRAIDTTATPVDPKTKPDK